MKRLILFAAFVCFVQIVNAQRLETSLKEFKLEGKVMELTEFEYYNVDRVDTSKDAPKTVMKFDEIGNATGKTIYDKYGKVTNNTIYNVAPDKSIMINRYNSDNQLQNLNKYVFKYDDKGNETELDNYFGANLNSLLKHIYRYDVNNNKIEEDTYSPETDKPAKEISLYNKKNQIVEIDTYDQDYYRFAKSILKYDSKGNLVDEDSYDFFGSLIMQDHYSYNKVDKHGNWILKTCEKRFVVGPQGDHTIKIVNKRNIKYY